MNRIDYGMTRRIVIFMLLLGLVLSLSSCDFSSSNYFGDSGLVILLASMNRSCTYVSLSNNRLSRIPLDAFAGMTNLSRLDLSHNEISFIHSDVFKGLESLEDLRLNNNRISHLRTSHFKWVNATLKSLNLDMNLVLKFPEDVFRGLSLLSNLNLNRVGPLFHNLPSMLLKGLYSLEVFHASKLPFVTHIPSTLLHDLPNLKVFKMDSCNIDISILDRDVFSWNPNLTSVDLSFNNFGVLTPFFRFPAAPSIKFLSLAGCKITQLYDDSFVGVPSVRILDLSMNLFPAIPYDMFTVMNKLNSLDVSGGRLRRLPAASLRDLLDLRKLYAGGNPLVYLNLFLGRISSLEVLEISGKELNNIVPSFLNHMSNLISFSLVDTNITNIPSDLFRNTGKLKEINLHGNLIEHLPGSLFSNVPELAFLDVSSNRLQDLPFEIFTGLSSLESVNLRDNQLKCGSDPRSEALIPSFLHDPYPSNFPICSTHTDNPCGRDCNHPTSDAHSHFWNYIVAGLAAVAIMIPVILLSFKRWLRRNVEAVPSQSPQGFSLVFSPLDPLIPSNHHQ